MQILLGEISLNDDLMRLDNVWASVIFFWSFIVIAFLILMNILLAILVDAYVEVRIWQLSVQLQSCSGCAIGYNLLLL